MITSEKKNAGTLVDRR